MRANLLVACLAVVLSVVGLSTIFPLAAAHADPVEVVADPAGAKGDVTDITIKDMAFGTPKAKVKKGTIVRWKNEDDMSHNVQLRGGPAKGWAKAQGPMLAKDQSYALKFNEPGEYKYICTPHSAVMKGEVAVE